MTQQKTANGRNWLLGQLGEHLAVQKLQNAGMVILDRNWRDGRNGEIDVIAREKHDYTVFLEVRTRIGKAKGSALESVTPVKVKQLRYLAGQWLRTHPNSGAVRIDCMAITFAQQHRGAIELLIERIRQGRHVDAADLLHLNPEILWIRGIA